MMQIFRRFPCILTVFHQPLSVGISLKFDGNYSLNYLLKLLIRGAFETQHLAVLVRFEGFDK